MREQFEKLPEIANILKGKRLRWNSKTKCYAGLDGKHCDDATPVNLALYAFQEVHKELLEQQKKIDGLNLKIQDLISKYESKTTLPILDQWSDCFVKSARGVVNDLKELLNDQRSNEKP